MMTEPGLLAGTSDTYKRFHQYDFNNDVRFQNGWRIVKGSLTNDQMPSELMKAKIFYYSKTVEEVNLDGYMAWLNTLNTTNSLDEDIGNTKSTDIPRTEESTTRGITHLVTNDNENISNAAKHKKLAVVDGEIKDIAKDSYIKVEKCASETKDIKHCCPHNPSISQVNEKELQVDNAAPLIDTTSSLLPSQQVDNPGSHVDTTASLLPSQQVDNPASHVDTTASLLPSQQVDNPGSHVDTTASLLPSQQVDNAASLEGSIGPKEISFGEIVEMLEKGMKIPGIEDLNIEPLNIEPNPSSMEKPKKPWEHR